MPARLARTLLFATCVTFAAAILFPLLETARSMNSPRFPTTAGRAADDPSLHETPIHTRGDPPLLDDPTGAWSKCHWDPDESIGWRSRTEYTERWLFVDAQSRQRTKRTESCPAVGGTPYFYNPAALELIGCSPCELWEDHRPVPKIWPRSAVRKARRQSIAENGYVGLVGHGWPFMQSWHLRWTNPQGNVQTDRWIGWTPNDRRRTSSDAATPGLPLGIHWLGLGANLLVWSVAIWLGNSAWQSWRRRSRRRRGLCACCTYPVSDGNVCSECGMRN